MKKLIATIVLSLAAFAAMAMPRPSDIENALAAHDYQSAQSMTQEVLRERPDSAKAHLFNAYVLLKANNDRQGAAAELRTARMLDRDHRVQESALFGRTAAEIEQPIARPVYQRPVRTYAPQPVYVDNQPSALAKLVKFLLWVSIIGLIVYIVYRVFFAPRAVVTTCTGHTYVSPAGTTARVYDDAPYVAPAQRVRSSAASHTIYERPQVVHSAPSTVVVHDNGANNLMTGMMLNEMMHSHGHHHHGYNSLDDTYATGGVIVDNSSAYGYGSTGIDTTPVRTDYETSRSSFSSGSDNDSWSSGSSSSSSSSSSDSWGSSSSSSSSDSWGSSSSSDSWSSSSDSGSSFDSGSSGGSDW